MVGDGASTHKKDERHQHRTTGLRVTAFFAEMGVLPIGGVASGRVCACFHA